MNSQGHYWISFAKSTIRLCSACISACTGNMMYMAIGFAVAEILGYVEEIVDKR